MLDRILHSTRRAPFPPISFESDSDASIAGASGGNPVFLEFLNEELLPELERTAGEAFATTLPDDDRFILSPDT